MVQLMQEFFLRKCDPYDTTFDRWSEEEVVEPDFRRDRSMLTLDAFSDSSSMMKGQHGNLLPQEWSSSMGVLF